MSDLDKIKAVFDEIGVEYQEISGSLRMNGQPDAPRIFLELVNGGKYGADCNMEFDANGSFIKTEVYGW